MSQSAANTAAPEAGDAAKRKLTIVKPEHGQQEPQQRKKLTIIRPGQAQKAAAAAQPSQAAPQQQPQEQKPKTKSGKKVKKAKEHPEAKQQQQTPPSTTTETPTTKAEETAATAEAVAKQSDVESVKEELGYLRKNFAGRITEEKSLEDAPQDNVLLVVRLSVKMEDDFPFDIKDNSLAVRLRFLRGYPAVLCELEVLNSEVPQSLRTKINAALATRAKAYKGNSAMASNLLRWLKNQAERLMVDKEITENKLSGITLAVPSGKHGAPMSIMEAMRKSKPVDLEEDLSGVMGAGQQQVVMICKPNQRKHHHQQQQKVIVQVVPQQHQAAAAAESETDKDEDTVDGEHKGESDDEVEEEEDADEDEDDELEQAIEQAKRNGGSRGPAYPTTTAHKGIQLLAEGLELVNVGILTCVGLGVVYSCSRCRQQDLAVLEPGQPHSDVCGRCQSHYTIGFRSEPMHESSNIVGYIDNDGVVPVDVISSSFVASCLACGADIEDQTLRPGVRHTDNCRACHARFDVFFSRVSMKRVRSAADTAAAAAQKKPKKSKQRDPREAGIHVGSPLPANVCFHHTHFVLPHAPTNTQMTHCRGVVLTGNVQALQAQLPVAAVPVLRAGVAVRPLPRREQRPPRGVGHAHDLRAVLQGAALLAERLCALRGVHDRAVQGTLGGRPRLPRQDKDGPPRRKEVRRHKQDRLPRRRGQKEADLSTRTRPLSLYQAMQYKQESAFLVLECCCDCGEATLPIVCLPACLPAGCVWKRRGG